VVRYVVVEADNICILLWGHPHVAPVALTAKTAASQPATAPAVLAGQLCRVPVVYVQQLATTRPARHAPAIHATTLVPAALIQHLQVA
jgi:hypothetical protein